MKKLIRVTCLTVLLLCGAVSVSAFRPETIITYDLIGPDGSIWVAKTIVGGAPLQFYPMYGWTISVRSIETK